MSLPPPTRTQFLDQATDLIRLVNVRANEVNKRWGFNLLPMLVPIEWMEKFQRQKSNWEMACFECVGSPKPEDMERIRQQGEAMLRAYDKLETVAVEQGHQPAPPTQWEFELEDGTPVILVRDRAEMSQIDPRGRKAQIWSLEEIADIVRKFPMLVAAKDAFPGAEVVRVKTDPKVMAHLEELNDEVPF